MKKEPSSQPECQLVGVRSIAWLGFIPSFFRDAYTLIKQGEIETLAIIFRLEVRYYLLVFDNRLLVLRLNVENLLFECKVLRLQSEIRLLIFKNKALRCYRELIFHWWYSGFNSGLTKQRNISSPNASGDLSAPGTREAAK